MSTAVWLLITGAIAGMIGAMVGVGGGFIAVPIMTLLLGLPPQLVVGTSLTMSFCNAFSSSIVLWKQGRIDFKTGWKFALASFPGAILGSQMVNCFSARGFQIVFGCLMLGISVLMWVRREPGADYQRSIGEQPPGTVNRVIIDAWGLEHRYQFNMYLGIGFSFFIGFISSIMGIGGGVIYVPLMVMVLKIPPHLAAATSLFILTWSSLVGAASHYYLGHIYAPYAAALALGGVVGAQMGIRLVSRVQGGVIVRMFALVNAVVGLRLIWG